MTAAHVAIVGGGITGLAAAYYLQEAAHEQVQNLSYTLLEGADRWGGKIRTETIPGEGHEPFVVEAGPDSFITQKPWAWQLARRMGLDDALLPTNDATRQIYVLNKGKPTPLPDGVLLIVPTKFTPFALSPLISPMGKLRMGLDLVLPAKRDGADETLAEFITRRLGAEALDKIAEPLMSGIYNAEADRQSVLATFPRFRAIEEKHGSLIRGMLAARHARNAPAANGQAPAAAAELEKIRYVSTGTISLAYRADEIGEVPPGHGLVVPASEARHVNAVTVSSSKFSRRAPAGMVLVRAFFGGSRTPQMMEVPDAELLTLVRAELRQTMGIRGAPLFHRIYRWPRANPQYDVGHLERVATIEAALPPGLFVSGSPYRGIGIPDCVHPAEQTVKGVLATLTAKRQSA
jgi:protoporphyrinogen oxidase